MPENKTYFPPNKSNWSGRASSPEEPNQYWHEVVNLIDIDKESETELNPSVVLIGYACDEGVRRNQGRVGAVNGPNAIRERLGKLPVHFNKVQVADVGDVRCDYGDMEASQEELANAVGSWIGRGAFPIVLGGGHDVAYGTFSGLRKAFHGQGKRIGIINFDAHFDLRKVEGQGNSGTPFYQILTEAKEREEQVDYIVVGFQSQSNSKSLFKTAEDFGVLGIPIEECEPDQESILQVQEKLEAFIHPCDVLYITIDMDGFSSAFAPGVSAPSPMGFAPSFVFKMLSFLFLSKKVVVCDVAELNPAYDRDNATAILAGRLVDHVVTLVEQVA